MSETRVVDVVVPLWNSERWLDGCLAGLAAQTLTPSSVIFVDDASTDGTRGRLEELLPSARTVLLEAHGGFARAANAGIRATDAPLVALLNVDTEARPEWLEELVEHLLAAGDRVGSAASQMLHLEAPELVDNAGDVFSRYGSARKRGHGEPADRWSQPGQVLSASAGAALYRRRMLDVVGLFDETFESYLEDVDLGLRAQLAGYDCVYVPTARVLHHGGGSGLPRPRYVRLMTANRVATVLKNLPGSLLLRHFLSLAWGQAYFLVAYRRPLSSLAGYLDLVRRLPAILRERRRIQQKRQGSTARVARLLSSELGEPPLHRLLLRRLRAR